MIFNNKYRCCGMVVLTLNLAVCASQQSQKTIRTLKDLIIDKIEFEGLKKPKGFPVLQTTRSSSVKDYAEFIIATLRPTTDDLWVISERLISVYYPQYTKRLNKEVFEPLARSYGFARYHFDHSTIAVDIFLERMIYRHAHKKDDNGKALIDYLSGAKIGQFLSNDLSEKLSGVEDRQPILKVLLETIDNFYEEVYRFYRGNRITFETARTLSKQRLEDFKVGKKLKPLYYNRKRSVWSANKSDNCIGFFE